MDETSRQAPNEPAETDLIPEIRQFILTQMNRRPDNRLVYHNYDFSVRLAEKVLEIADGQSLTSGQREVAQIAAWFVAIGYLLEYDNPARSSQAIARRFLESKRYPEEKQRRVLKCLEAGSKDVAPASPEEQVMEDALTAVNYTDGYDERMPLQKLEWELKTGRQTSRLDWARLQLQRLLAARLYTHYARSHYEGVLAQNIRRQKERVEKLLRKQSPEIAEEKERAPARYEGLEEDVPRRALQTFFRSNYRNHINLSAIADNKANIMISVNSILISVLLTILTYRNMANINPKVVLPAVIFLVSALVSLIFAILSARPKVTTLNDRDTPQETVRKNIVFFGNYVNLDLDQYEEAVDAVFRDSELLYGNMVRDLYYLGQVLAKKYRYLTISYNVFMLGFVATVVTFLFALFL